MSLPCNLRTLYRCASNHAWRRCSYATCASSPSWLSPSSSTMSRAAKHTKSTTYGPIAACLRNFHPLICRPRRCCHMRHSDVVMFVRSSRARFVSGEGTCGPSSRNVAPASQAVNTGCATLDLPSGAFGATSPASGEDNRCNPGRPLRRLRRHLPGKRGGHNLQDLPASRGRWPAKPAGGGVQLGTPSSSPLAGEVAGGARRRGRSGLHRPRG